jgi:HAMP domain-containing protein
MSKSRSIKFKTIVPLLTILAVAMTGLAVYNYFSQVSLLNRKGEETLRNTLNSAQNVIHGQASQYQQMSILLSNMPLITDLYGKGDRNRLRSELLPAFESLKKNFQYNRLHFYAPLATSFLRLHDPSKFGDDESAYRHAIVYVNQKQTATQGVEIGARGLALRGIEPMFFKGAHTGAVEFGGDLAPAIDEVKSVFNVEAGILLSKEAMLQVLPDWQQQDAKLVGNQIFFYSTNPQLAQGMLSPTLVNSKAAAGGIIMGNGSYGGRNYYIGLGPLLDFSGKQIGFLYVLKDRTALLAKIRNVLLINVAMYFSLLIVISLAINISLNKTVINPVLSLTKTADEISMGKLSEKIEAKTNDEISMLAKSIDRMRVSMKKLLE